MMSREIHRGFREKLMMLTATGALFLFGTNAGAESPRDLTKKALTEIKQGNLQRALALYDSAGVGLPEIPELEFNRGILQAKMGEIDSALKALDHATMSSAPEVAPQAYYNLGNALYEKQDYAGAVESYKNALRADPDNEAAKRNLELALSKLQSGQNQDQEEQDEKENKEDENDQQQDKQNQDQQDKNKQDQQQDQQQEQEQQPDSTQNQPEKQQQQKPDPRRMSKEDAERILNALKDQEAKQQKKKRLLSPRIYLGKDW